MAASMVCVSLNGKGNLDIHEEGRNGYIIDPANPKAFAQALVNCAKHPERYLQISEYSYHFAKRFDIKPYTSNLIEIYKTAIENKSELKSS
jgi:glycosyltransferase involved in cell wall biosynthesis